MNFGVDQAMKVMAALGTLLSGISFHSWLEAEKEISSFL